MNTHRTSPWLSTLLYALPIVIALFGFGMAHAAGAPVQELPRVVVHGKSVAGHAAKAAAMPVQALPRVVVSGKHQPQTLALACVTTATKVC
jgi:hypothetical protein